MFESVDLGTFDGAHAGRTITLRARMSASELREVKQVLAFGTAPQVAAAIAFVLGVSVDGIESALVNVPDAVKLRLFTWTRGAGGYMARPWVLDLHDATAYADATRAREAVL